MKELLRMIKQFICWLFWIDEDDGIIKEENNEKRVDNSTNKEGNENMEKETKTEAAQIKQLNGKQLYNCTCTGDIYPITSTYAVMSIDKDGNPIEGVEGVLEDRLKVLERTVATLQAEIEALKTKTEEDDLEEFSEEETREMMSK